MKNLFGVLIASLVFFAPVLMLAAPSTPGVRDAANMFSRDACKQADEKLAAVHKSHGWEIVFETVDSLGGKSVDQLALDKARSLQVRGVFVLLAKAEHKISVQVNKPAASVFDRNVQTTFKEKVTAGFKAKKFDDGLLDGVNYLADIASTRAAATGVAPQGQPAPRGPPAPAGEAGGRGSILGTVLVIGAVIAGVLLLVRLFSGMGRSGAGGVGSGGGFFSSLFGAIGGVFLGNWLYNSFFGGSAHASDSPDHSSGTDAYNDQYESTSGDWGDGGGDAGGDGGGGDW